MNTKELYDSINQLPSILGWQGHGAKVMIAKDSVMQLVRQLDEPQKVVVPKFVAEKIKYCKANSGYNLFHAMDYCFEYEDSADWLECNQETFARAWLDGYEVEREKLYTVEVPDPNRKGKNRVHLTKDPTTGKIFVTKGNFNPETNKQTWLTESEIRKDFDWAWQAGFAKEVG